MTTDTRTDRRHDKTDPSARDWAAIATGPVVLREERLVRYYAALAALPEDARRTELRAMVGVTYGLPDDAFRALTESRLRAWLRLDEAAAARVARSYDAVLGELSARDAMRRVAVVQTLMRDLPEEDQRRLRELNPEERARGLVLTRLGSFAEGTDPGA